MMIIMLMVIMMIILTMIMKFLLVCLYLLKLPSEWWFGGWDRTRGEPAGPGSGHMLCL